MPFPPYPSVPAPSTWTAGELVTAPQLRSDVANAIAFLANKPAFLGQISTGNSISSGVTQPLGMNIELTDNWGGHNAGVAFGTQYFCQAPGWYLCQGSVPWSYGTATQELFAAVFSGLSSGAAFSINGPLTMFGAGSGKNPQPQAVDLIEQTVTGPAGGTGDYIVLNGYQDTGGAIPLLAQTDLLPYVLIRWVAATTGTTSLPVPSNPAWAVPPAYITSAFANANIRDTIRFLTYPPVMKAIYTPGSSTLASTTFPAGTQLAFNTTVADNYGGFTPGGGYTALVGGVYFCYTQVNLAVYAGQNDLAAGFRVNSGTITWCSNVYTASGGSFGAGVMARKRLRLNAGDVVYPYACQGSGSAVAYNTSAVNQSRFIVIWEGA